MGRKVKRHAVAGLDVELLGQQIGSLGDPGAEHATRELDALALGGAGAVVIGGDPRAATVALQGGQ